VRLRALASIAFLLSLAGQAPGADPGLVWRTVESEHFVVHFYEPHADLAHRVAICAERAHQVLSPILQHAPVDKTQVVITDHTDGANGFAQVIPRNALHLFLSAPDPLSVLGDSDDWLYGLIVHEYTHILHLDTVHGIPKLYNLIFGKTWAPNGVQPRWFVEGIATYQESKRTGGGRTRNAIFDAYLRVSVLAGKHLDLDRISSSNWFWPHGHIAYLYGSHFVRYVADRYGDDKLAAISLDYGTQPIPFGLNRSVKRAVGKSYVELYDEWRGHLKRRYALQRDAVLRRGLIEGRRITDTHETNSAPRYSADGKEIFWNRSDGWSRTQYRAMPAAGDATASRQLAQIDGAGAFSSLPDGSGLVFERWGTYRTNYDFVDLWRYRFKDGALTRLTRGARTISPDVSPDGKTIAFVQNGASRMTVALMANVPGATPQVVWSGKGRFDHAADPAWSPDGKQLVFSAWQEGGAVDLFLMDVATRRTVKLTDDRAMKTAPVWSSDGKWIAFTSDRTGILNIFALSVAEPSRVKQLTNVLGGAFTFDLSPDGKRMVFQDIDADGGLLRELAFDPEHAPDAEVYVNDRPDPSGPRDDAFPVTAPRSYRPLETLSPLIYTLATSIDSFGSAITLATGADDIVGHHSYSLGVTLGLTRGDVQVGVGYAFNKWWPSLRLGLTRGVGTSGGLVINEERLRYEDEVWSGSLSVGLPVLRRPGLSADLSFGYELDYSRNLDGPIMQDPNNTVPRIPTDGVNAGVGIRWSMSNGRRFAFSLGPAEGRSLTLGLRVDHPALGADFRRVDLSWRWQEFFSLPWLHHIVSFRYAGGLIDTDRAGGGFSLGGTPDQDIVDAILNLTRVGTVYLHGYPPGTVQGRQYHLANVEYRVPLFSIERGVSTLPAYLGRMHFAFLLDAGNATSGAFDPTDLRVSLGGALRLDASFAFGVGGTFELGYARGLGTGGTDEVWFLLTSGI
jgi:Tol biopolymer transport system component